MTQIYSCDQVEPPTPTWSFFFTNCEPSIDVNDKIEGNGSLLLSPLGVAWESRFQIVFNPPYHEDWSTKLGIQLSEKVEAARYPIKITIFAPDYANRLEITIEPAVADFWENPSILFNEMTSYGTPNLADVTSLNIWLIRQNQTLWFKLDDIRTIEEAPPPPPEWLLTVDSTPISGVPLTINIGGVPTSLVTPWSGPLAERTYVVTIPSSVLVNGENYNFIQWKDGYTLPSRAINLIADITITTIYEVGPTQPKPLCFIATAAYGSPFASELNVLRQFRDQCLPDRLVHVYYKTGPYLAQFIKSRKAIKRYVRTALNLFVKMIKCQQ
ncbi:hypothetical protein ES703_34512 [subsurface metagenome]